MVINYKNTAMLSNSRYLTHNHTHMTGEERRNSMEREISSNRSSCSGAREPSSSVASSSVAVPGEEANAHVHVRESAAAAEQSERWNMESVVDQLVFLIKKSAHRRQSNDGSNSQNNFASKNNSTVVGAVAAGVVVVDAIIPACNETVSDEKKNEKSSKKKRSRGSSSSEHTCEVCGETFAKGQSLGGHKRKHYDIQKIIDKRRAREKQKETPAPAVERRGHTVAAAMVKIEEERMASSCNATFDLHNPALLLQSVQLVGPSATNGARRPHDFDLNEPAAPEEESENAPQPETERKDNDADDLLSFRLWPKFDSQISNSA